MVVGGDGEAHYDYGVMQRGTMYAKSSGGAHSRQYCRVEWDADISAGVPAGPFVLGLKRVRGFTPASAFPIHLIVPQHTGRGRSGSPSRELFVSRFVRDPCHHHLGIGVVLRRVGGGILSSTSWLRALMSEVGRTRLRNFCTR